MTPKCTKQDNRYKGEQSKQHKLYKKVSTLENSESSSIITVVETIVHFKTCFKLVHYMMYIHVHTTFATYKKCIVPTCSLVLAGGAKTFGVSARLTGSNW